MQGDKRVDELMLPVLNAINRHVKDGDAKTDIYNRAYEALLISMDVKDMEISNLSSEVSALREQVRWIPVSERLPELKTCASREDIICPEDYTIVITVDDKGYVSPAYFSYDGMFLDDYETPAEPMVYGKTLFFSECLDYSSEIINNVTHWMPLPQPPEAE